MKNVVLVDGEHGHWDPRGEFDTDMGLLWSLLSHDSPGFVEYCLEFLAHKDWESGGGNLVDLDRYENGYITLSYEYEDDGHKFTIKESELEKILVGWLKLIKSGAKEITIESQDDEHYTITGK